MVEAALAVHLWDATFALLGAIVGALVVWAWHQPVIARRDQRIRELEEERGVRLDNWFGPRPFASLEGRRRG